MSLSYDWDEVFGWIGHDEGYDYSPAGALGYLPRCLNSPLVMDMMTHYLTEIKVMGWNLVLPETMYTGWTVNCRHTSDWVTCLFYFVQLKGRLLYC